MANLLGAHIIDANCVAIILIVRLSTNEDAFPYSDLTVIVTDTNNLGIEHAELSIIVVLTKTYVLNGCNEIILSIIVIVITVDVDWLILNTM